MRIRPTLISERTRSTRLRRSDCCSIAIRKIVLGPTPASGQPVYGWLGSDATRLSRNLSPPVTKSGLRVREKPSVYHVMSAQIALLLTLPLALLLTGQRDM